MSQSRLCLVAPSLGSPRAPAGRLLPGAGGRGLGRAGLPGCAAPQAVTWDVMAPESQTQEVQSFCGLKISDHVHGAPKTHGS